jgi:hypothetical protein
MRQLALICSMFSIAMMLVPTAPKSFAQQEIESKRGQIVLNATITPSTSRTSS